MKKQTIQFVCVVALILSIPSSDAFAQSFKNYPTKNVLEYSLSSLYSRAEQIAEQNKWLEEEIEGLKEEQKNLRYQSSMIDKEMMVLKDHTYGVKDSFDAKIRELQLSQANTVILSKQIQELAVQEQQLAQEFQSRQRTQQVLQEDIATAINQLAQLDYEGVDEAILRKDADLKLKKAQLSKMRAELFSEIQIFQSKIQQSQQEQPQILNEYSHLKSEQTELTKQLQSLEVEVEMLKKKRDELSLRLNPEPTAEQDNAQDVAKNILELKKRRVELTQYLAQVEEKTNQANLGGDLTERERQLQDNLLVIKKENTELMTELDNALLGK